MPGQCLECRDFEVELVNQPRKLRRPVEQTTAECRHQPAVVADRPSFASLGAEALPHGIVEHTIVAHIERTLCSLSEADTSKVEADASAT